MTNDEIDALLSEAGYMVKVHRDLIDWSRDPLDNESYEMIADTTERQIAAIEQLRPVKAQAHPLGEAKPKPDTSYGNGLLG
jgi:hypothetical protein